ncbi:helix-turn-helix domain-containing protein [Paenibacillus sp. YN15]|uniref:helix-turn-helix domain-containing protein n=1 Tax=Paenibacillus sp. YN15 TaxID=1742774 RepID=UPI000DCF1DDF|nr:helix-turn-helix domain-containing protein [Paenibacillus sp. YN15]RAV01965.1 hypothetical protein DQG13_10580 [Paenibacillus sp. YN15]
MKKNWFHQLLLSYLPVFLITSLVIILLFFVTISELAMQETRKVNRFQSQALLDAVDQTLLNVERTVIKDLMNNQQVETFFQRNAVADYLGEQTVARMLRDIGSYLPDLHSVLLYRKSDNTILTAASKIPVSEHPDLAFLEKADELAGGYWSDLREIPGDDGSIAPVVTMVKRMNPPAGREGLIIINVGVNSLDRILKDSVRSSLNYVTLHDANGALLAASGKEKDGKVVSELVSPYSRWTIKGGFHRESAYGVFSTLSLVWMFIAFLTLTAGIVWIVHVSRRNYRPIQMIINRLQQSSMLRRQWTGGDNQLAVIEKAIDSLVEQAAVLERQNDEMSEYRTRHYFKEWLEGSFPPGDPGKEVEQLGIPEDAQGYAVAVLEIDRHIEFASSYHSRDQLLLKYIVSSVIKEIAEQKRVLVWAEWMSSSRLGILLVAKPQETASGLKEVVYSLAQQTAAWLLENVRFTVTIGVSPIAGDLEEIPEAYEDAVRALSYKSVAGSNRVLSLDELQVEGQRPDYVHTLASARQLSESIRLGEESWRDEFAQFFRQLETDKPSSPELSRLLHYLIYQLQNEISELPADVQQVWAQDAMPKLYEGMKRLETLKELNRLFASVLEETVETIGLLRQAKAHHPMVSEVKGWIGENYADPDFSLMAVSEHFNLHPNYVSRLFREEFGIKFVDYVTKVRIEKAKELLAEGKAPIQDIALQVGYLRPLSFIRVFKKSVGMTPGEYRKNQQHPGSPVSE